MCCVQSTVRVRSRLAISSLGHPTQLDYLRLIIYWLKCDINIKLQEISNDVNNFSDSIFRSRSFFRGLFFPSASFFFFYQLKPLRPRKLFLVRVQKLLSQWLSQVVSAPVVSLFIAARTLPYYTDDVVKFR